MGTKTCQLLVAGAYNGVLRAREHYIEVQPDLANIDDAIELFNDDAERSAIVDRAYESVLSAHTYAHRVSYLISATLSPS